MPHDVTRPKYVFIDIDIDNHREKYSLASEFVESTDLRYNWTSKDIKKLGGGERARIREMFENDYEWSQRGEIECERAEKERVVFEMFWEQSPLACENFLHLCLGDRGCSKTFGGVKYDYRNSVFHRVVKGFMMQGGDFVHSNGTGGESIWGKKFKDEQGGLKLKHDEIGILSMGNTGKNSNGSQFFITLDKAKQCDGKHVVFGKVFKGIELLKKINDTLARDASDMIETPLKVIKIADCGIFVED
jgi:peptidylprolyl isomerase